MKFNRVSVPTLKESPAEAEIISHELLLRAGMIRSVAAGIYTLLPLGALALERIEQVVREEMNSVGALEIVLPSLQPADPWIQSGRWEAYGPEMMRLKDRAGREFCLAPTAEEMVTTAVGKTAPSYRDLPLCLYQIQTKYRDERRPRFGLLRGREFRMMDAYSFHTDADQLEITYAEIFNAYLEIARRCSLETRVVDAATGNIGGSESSEFMVISEVGEDTLVYCDSCRYGANSELEKHRPSIDYGGEPSAAERIHTPGIRTVEELAGFTGRTADSLLKCVLYVAGNEPLAVFVPGYREVSEAKLASVLGTEDFHVMREDERALYPELAAGFVGPVGLKGAKAIFDTEITGSKGLVCGANEYDHHLVGVEEGRDFNADPIADIAGAVDGDLCPECDGRLSLARGIEIGHIFKLGTRYTETLGVDYSGEDGTLHKVVMGTYGIGTSRMLQTVVEQHHDERGIVWPRAIAPLPVQIIVVGAQDKEQLDAAAGIEAALAARGFEALVDDRAVSPGVKFNDADLIGLPVQITVGKKLVDGMVDIKIRHSGERMDVAVDSVLTEFERLYDGLP